MKTKKALDRSQELNSSVGGTFNRNPSSSSDNNAKVAPQPVEQTQPDFLTDSLLHSTINNSKVKIIRNIYFPIKPYLKPYFNIMFKKINIILNLLNMLKSLTGKRTFHCCNTIYRC